MGNCRLFVLLEVTRDELSHQITIVIENIRFVQKQSSKLQNSE